MTLDDREEWEEQSISPDRLLLIAVKTISVKNNAAAPTSLHSFD